MTHKLLILIAVTAAFIQASFENIEDTLKDFRRIIKERERSAIGKLFGCVTLPKVCPNVNVTFWLHTRKTQNSPRKLDPTKPETFSAAFDKNPVKIIIHGFGENRDTSAAAKIRPALFQHGEYNVISVDYDSAVRKPCYLTAVKNVDVVANCTAQLIDGLVKNGTIELDNIHVIGFSLGAQVAGVLPNFLKSGILRRITGLDPAFPKFVFTGLHKGLSALSAKFVDVLHTNAWLAGQPLRTGHVDFYANGGTVQPGCTITKKNITLSEWFENIVNSTTCDHARAPIYYAESINSKAGFWARHCVDYYSCAIAPRRANEEAEIMGEFVNTKLV